VDRTCTGVGGVGFLQCGEKVLEGVVEGPEREFGGWATGSGIPVSKFSCDRHVPLFCSTFVTGWTCRLCGGAYSDPHFWHPA